MKENDKFVVVAVVGISGQIDSWTTNTHTHMYDKWQKYMDG